MVPDFVSAYQYTHWGKGAIGNSGNGNQKWKMEMENGNGQNLT